jgi:glycosyltransferase involved in cell wall biosynthesis
MKIGIAIPCYKYHLQKLKRCLDSIEAQEVKPDLVVVSSSSCEQSDVPAEYEDGHYSFSLKILTFRNRQNAAENRNIAAAVCKFEGCTHISFFDGDDEMHPQRIKSICFAIQSQPTTTIILHSYLDSEEDLKQPFRLYNRVSVVLNKLRRAPSGCAVLEGDGGARIHHSQCTVKREILDQIKFREDKDHERKEDAVFCGDVLAIPNVQSVYICEPLSKYYFEGAWF